MGRAGEPEERRDQPSMRTHQGGPEVFVKHKGKIPAKFARKSAIRKKWHAVAKIVKAVAAAAR